MPPSTPAPSLSPVPAPTKSTSSPLLFPTILYESENNRGEDSNVELTIVYVMAFVGGAGLLVGLGVFGYRVSWGPSSLCTTQRASTLAACSTSHNENPHLDTMQQWGESTKRPRFLSSARSRDEVPGLEMKRDPFSKARSIRETGVASTEEDDELGMSSNPMGLSRGTPGLIAPNGRTKAPAHQLSTTSQSSSEMI